MRSRNEAPRGKSPTRHSRYGDGATAGFQSGISPQPNPPSPKASARFAPFIPAAPGFAERLRQGERRRGISAEANKPLIGITMGDPQGIGPEVIEKALARPSLLRLCRPVVFGDPAYFNFRSAKKLTPKECGRLSALFIGQAAHAALKGEIDAMVTAPISKERLHLAGCRFAGHTELLADLTGAKKVRMMMMGPRLKVVLANIHEPLRRVPQMLNAGSLLETIEIANLHLKNWFRIGRPRIAVAALNPHAGEGGLFGSEEKSGIRPAIEKARKKRIDASGPFSPDTVFYRASRGEFDAVVAMYHDQGLIPLKLLHFHEAVNITLGLPFIRTSVDHGTAFEIAGGGEANAASLIAAIKLAVELSGQGGFND